MFRLAPPCTMVPHEESWGVCSCFQAQRAWHDSPHPSSLWHSQTGRRQVGIDWKSCQKSFCHKPWLAGREKIKIPVRNNLPGSVSVEVIPGRLNGVFKSIQSQQLAKQEEGKGSSDVDQRLFVTTSGVLMYHLPITLWLHTF